MEWHFKLSVLLVLAKLFASSFAAFPVLHSWPTVRTDKCASGDSQVTSVGRNFVKSRIDPQLNGRYGPPCHCGSSNWTRLIYNYSSEDWKECSERVPDCKYISKSVSKPYSKVCGTVRASYKENPNLDSPFAFENYFLQQKMINGAYLNGLSVTRIGVDGNRNHVWSFVVPQDRGDDIYVPHKNCECSNTNSYWPFRLPDFVQDHYFCDSSETGKGDLWSGQDCGKSSTCCDRPSPASWFCRNFVDGSPTSNDALEVRHFGDSINISLIDIYVGN